MDHDTYSDAYIEEILRSTRVIALVGASAKPARPSHQVMKFLLDMGYEVIPVNPGLDGHLLHGQRAYARLDEIPQAVDMVDIFRNSAAAGGVMDEAVEIGAKVAWMQLGVRDDAAARRAEAAGLKVVMNRCPKPEHRRLIGQ